MREPSSRTVWQALNDWSDQLRPWQQFILSKAISEGRLTDADIQSAYSSFLHSAGLNESEPSSEAPRERALRSEVPTKPICLLKLDGLAGVNAIPDGAQLTFDPCLTVVYGCNGAGKSGFARVFANACFSRYKPSILANIYAEASSVAAEATFHISLDGEPQSPVLFSIGLDHQELKRLSFFDVTIAKLHVTQASSVEFKPSGFDVFPEMARVYAELAKRMAADIERRTQPADFSKSFIGDETVVSKAVADIGPKTDIEPLRKLAVYGPTEEARLKEVDEHLLALRSKSPQERIAVLNAAKRDIEALISKLNGLSVHFTTVAEQSRNDLARAAKECADTAALVGTETFKRPFFKAVGTPQWDEFARAAHALARAESDTYPKSNDRCLLCEQPLGDEARTHISAVLAFVQGEAKAAAEQSAALVQKAVSALKILDTGIFSEGSTVRAHLQRLDPAVEALIAADLAAMEKVRQEALSSLRALSASSGTVDCGNIIEQLAALRDRVVADIEHLGQEDPAKAIAAAGLERQTLRHRNVLSQLLPAVETHVASLKWRAKADRAKTLLSPRHITDKEKELFIELIGQSYRERLAAECDDLACALPIEVQTAGQRGQTVRSIHMKGGHKPDLILSEGEQRAVALADFLTEVGLNPITGGIVLDDPVTSQDHDRKGRIARRLVKEASARQVIVFTHDLPFLNMLVSTAEAEGCSCQTHWIQRKDDGTPGHVCLDDAPVPSKAYDTTERAKQCLAEAKQLDGKQQLDAIAKGMGALRRTLEEAVPKRLFKGVVPRWSDRVIVTALPKIWWDDAHVKDLCALYEELSAYIDGHSHTDEAMGAPPTVKMLSDMIARVEELLGRIKKDKPKG